MAAAVTGTTFFGTGIPVQAENEWIGDDQLTDVQVDAPAPDDVVPNDTQYKYQKDELAAFCHFGPNTFNNIEWGEDYGDKAPSEIFRLENDFDAETLVKAVKDAGFKKLIVTAKHHDGFCIWQSGETEYDMGGVTYKDGKGDILEEISAACTAENIDMGLYLSPWDIHEPSYGYYDENGKPTNAQGDVLDYNEFYNDQLKEILGNDKYGNNGRFTEVWMDGAKGGGADAQEYDFELWNNTIQEYEPECMIFQCGAYTTVHWIGNENGLAAKDTWAKINVDDTTFYSNIQNGYALGFENGTKWSVPEADTKITSGWFWGPNKKTPLSMESLSNIYFNSVGHNAPLLLNIPPNDQGEVDEAILNRLEEFGNNIKETFAVNLASASGAEVKASAVRGNSKTFSPGKTVDEDDSTYWTTDDAANSGQLLIDLGSEKKFDVVSIEEAIQNGQHINSYKVEYRTGDGEWTTMDEGKTIGAKRLVRTAAVRADQVRITVSAPEGKVPMISEIGVYKASEGFELAGSAPLGMDVVDIEDTNTADGAGFDFGNSTWTAETGTNFINGTNRWTKAGGELTFKFHGSKFYILGTKDPGHGNAAVTIDGMEPETVSTKADSRATGQMWYTSPDLEDGDHTVTIRAVDGPIGIEAAYVINNGGVGMIGLEQTEYTMNEDETINVKVIRVGGSTGEISALLTGNPGSAVQGDFDTTPQTVTMGDGVTETTVPVTSRRSDDEREPVESRDFTIVLDTPSPENLILGFNDTAKVNILDAEWMTKDKLQALVDEVDGRAEGEWTGDYAAYAAALAEAKALIAAEDPDALDMMLAYQKLEAAAGAMAEAVKVTASVDGGHGSVSIEPDQEVYDAGTEITVKFTPEDGYAVEDVLVNDASVMTDEIRNTNSYTFTLTENASITVKYAFANYTENNRFYFPTEVNGEAKLLEAENCVREDTGTGTGIRVDTGADWASGNAFINWMNSGDKLILNYYAQAAGTYNVTMTYRSGSTANSISWAGDNITSGNIDKVEADSSGSTTYTKEFTIEITKPGPGTVTFTAGEKNAPLIDKFDIQLTTAGETLTTDNAALGEKIAEARAEAAKADVYTADSIANLEKAIEAAQEVFDTSSTQTQEAVDTQVRLLDEALKSLVEIPKYKVEVELSGDGTINVGGTDDESFVQQGGTVTYEVKASEGCVIDELTVNGAAVADAAGKTLYSGTVENVTADVKISVILKAEAPQPSETHQISVATDGNGSISLVGINEDGTVTDGNAVTYTVEAFKGYVIDTVSINGQTVADVSGKTSFTDTINNVTSDISINATFKKAEAGKPGTGGDNPSADKPADTSKPSGGGKDKAAQTGDTANFAVWGAAALLAGTAAVVTGKKRKSEK